MLKGLLNSKCLVDDDDDDDDNDDDDDLHFLFTGCLSTVPTPYLCTYVRLEGEFLSVLHHWYCLWSS